MICILNPCNKIKYQDIRNKIDFQQKKKNMKFLKVIKIIKKQKNKTIILTIKLKKECLIYFFHLFQLHVEKKCLRVSMQKMKVLNNGSSLWSQSLLIKLILFKKNKSSQIEHGAMTHFFSLMYYLQVLKVSRL